MRKLFFFLTLLSLPLIADRTTSIPRDFHAELSHQDQQDIRYIVLTLAANNPLTILPHANNLTKAGDRIVPVHPLPFLAYIFTQEELKVGIRNLKKQNGKLWREFMDGLSGSLTEESHRNNLTLEMIASFAQQVGIDVRMIDSLAKGYRWYDFVNTLIVKIPRQGDNGRYDM